MFPQPTHVSLPLFPGRHPTDQRAGELVENPQFDVFHLVTLKAEIR